MVREPHFPLEARVALEKRIHMLVGPEADEASGVRSLRRELHPQEQPTRQRMQSVGSGPRYHWQEPPDRLRGRGGSSYFQLQLEESFDAEALLRVGKDRDPAVPEECGQGASARLG